MSPAPFIGNGCGLAVPSTPTLTTSRVPHALNTWLLPHYTKRFTLLAEIEAPWASTRVYVRLFESVVDTSVFSLTCQSAQRDLSHLV
jgi:hypothetical protein